MQGETALAKTEYFDNAAGRLHSILAELRRSRPGPETVIGGWARVLKVDEPRSPILLQEVAAVIQLPDRIREQITRLAGADAEDILEHLPNIEEALKFSFYLENPLGELLAKFSDADLLGLWYCSRELHRLSPEPELPSERREDLLEAVQVLIYMTQESGTPVDMRLFIIRHLMAVQRALVEYRVRGIDGVRNALLVATAAFLSEPDLQEEAKKTGIWKRVIDFLTGAGVAVDSAAKISRGTADILELMAGSGNPSGS